MASGEIDSRCHKFWLSVEFLKVYVQKNLQATILFVDFTKAFDSIHRGKMEISTRLRPTKRNRRSHNDAL